MLCFLFRLFSLHYTCVAGGGWARHNGGQIVVGVGGADVQTIVDFRGATYDDGKRLDGRERLAAVDLPSSLYCGRTE